MLSVSELYECGKYAEVIRSIDSEEFKAGEDPMLAQIVAASHFRLGNYSDALLLLKEIESCFSNDSNYLSLYGACLRRCGDLESSRFQLEQALQIQPNDPSIRNNFANLLIDLRDFQLAETILLQLLSDNPNYEDAQVNLQRLREKQRIQLLNSSDIHSSRSLIPSLDDPLMLAFGDDEVQSTWPRKADPDQGQFELKDKLPPLKQQQVAADQLALAIQALGEGRYTFTLQLCSQVHQSMPASAALFECVSDAYIALQRFSEGETCLLHALHLGTKSFKIYANLTSLLCIRQDFVLAQHYLEQASLLDQANPLLSKLRSQIAKAQEGKNLPVVRFDREWFRPELTMKQS
jgi:Flp pilus assembly protein TadD